jgi:hypothetical protein
LILAKRGRRGGEAGAQRAPCTHTPYSPCRHFGVLVVPHVQQLRLAESPWGARGTWQRMRVRREGVDHRYTGRWRQRTAGEPRSALSLTPALLGVASLSRSEGLHEEAKWPRKPEGLLSPDICSKGGRVTCGWMAAWC